MGTNFVNGDKPKNRITISKGGDVPPRRINADTGRQDRSFAQPNPAKPLPEVEKKAHATAQDEVEALSKNSKKGRKYESRNEDGTENAE